MKNMKQIKLKQAFDKYIGLGSLVKQADRSRFLEWVQNSSNKGRFHVFPAILTVLLIFGFGVTGGILVLGNIDLTYTPAREPDLIVTQEEEENQQEETTGEQTLEEIFDEDPTLEKLYQELVNRFEQLAVYRESKYEYAEVMIYYLNAVWTGNETLIEKYLSPLPNDYQQQVWYEKNLPFYEEVLDFDVHVKHVVPSLGEPVVDIQLNYISGNTIKSRIYHLDLQNPEHEQYMTIWDSDNQNIIEEDEARWRIVRWNAQIGLTKDLAIELFGDPVLKGNIDDQEVWLFNQVVDGYEYTPSLETVATEDIRNKHVYYQLYLTFEKNRVIRLALYTRSKDGSVYEYIKNSEYEVTEGVYEE